MSVDKKKKKWNKARAEEVLAFLDRGECALRKKSVEFDSNKGWETLGYKTCMDCLKDRLKSVSASTIYRYIQAGKVEKALELEIGNQAMTAMLEISKYEEDEWEVIWEKVKGEERPSVAYIKAAINVLIDEGRICPLIKNERTEISITVRMEKIKEELNSFDVESLEELKSLIVNKIESLDGDESEDDFD